MSEHIQERNHMLVNTVVRNLPNRKICVTILELIQEINHILIMYSVHVISYR